MLVTGALSAALLEWKAGHLVARLIEQPCEVVDFDLDSAIGQITPKRALGAELFCFYRGIFRDTPHPRHECSEIPRGSTASSFEIHFGMLVGSLGQDDMEFFFAPEREDFQPPIRPTTNHEKVAVEALASIAIQNLLVFGIPKRSNR